MKITCKQNNKCEVAYKTIKAKNVFNKLDLSDNVQMKTSISMFKLHSFPQEIIQYAVWVYHWFNMSHRGIEDLLAERGIEVSYESIRSWCNKFGPLYVRRLKRRY